MRERAARRRRARRRADRGAARPRRARRPRRRIDRIEGGEAFATVAAEVSDDFTATTGGPLGWFGSDDAAYGEYFDALADAEVGDLVGPIETETGFAVLELLDRRERTTEGPLPRPPRGPGHRRRRRTATTCASELLVDAFRGHFDSEVVVSPTAQQRVAQIFIAAPTGAIVPQERARHVLVQPLPGAQDQTGATDEQWEAARVEAEEVHELLAADDADWFAIAEEHSDDTGSGAARRRPGLVRPGQHRFVAEFSEALAGLEVGELSASRCAREFGWHVIEKTGERTSPQAQAAELVDPAARRPGQLRRGRDATSARIRETAREGGELGWVARYQLDEALEEVVFGLTEVDEISEPHDAGERRDHHLQAARVEREPRDRGGAARRDPRVRLRPLARAGGARAGRALDRSGSSRPSTAPPEPMTAGALAARRRAAGGGRASIPRDGVQLSSAGRLAGIAFDPSLPLIILAAAGAAGAIRAPGRHARRGPRAVLAALYPLEHELRALPAREPRRLGDLDDAALRRDDLAGPAARPGREPRQPARHGRHQRPPARARRLPLGSDARRTSRCARTCSRRRTRRSTPSSTAAPADLAEELGDLLLQVILHAQFAAEEGAFDLTDVYRSIAAKIVRRHPHVFGDVEVDGVEQVLTNWETIKADERAERGKAAEGAFGGVARALPALPGSREIQERASALGWDWDAIDGVWEKVGEELDELRAAAEATRIGCTSSATSCSRSSTLRAG